MNSSVILIFLAYLIGVHAEKVQILSNIHLNGSFAAQLELLIHRVRLSRVDIDKFTALHDDAMAVLKRRWPDIRLIPFGSTETGLSLIGSDIDYRVQPPEYVTQSPAELVTRAERSLRKFPRLFTVNKVSLNFTVPSITFTHKATNVKADLIFNALASEYETRLMKYLLTLDHRVYPLMIFIKFWAKLHGLIISRQMPSFGWLQLVVFYLQQVGVLPPIFTLQRAMPIYVNNWNVEFDESSKDLYVSDNSKSLYLLLGGFFEYYADFDFENHVISTFTAMSIRREFFLDYEHLPIVYEMYKYNIRNNFTEELNIDTALCVQSPLAHNKNIAEALTDDLADRIVSYIQKAAELFEEVEEVAFISKLLYMTDEDVNEMLQINENIEMSSSAIRI